MTLSSLRLQSFRCYTSLKELVFSPQTTWIIGENARGKTSILEAIYMLSTGRGFREEQEVELLAFGHLHGFVQGQFVSAEARLTEGTVTYKSDDEISLLKKYFVDKVPVGLVKFRRMQPPVVLFAPQQLEIVTGSPSTRREYFNILLAKSHPTYGKAIREYEIALRKRNAVLEEYMSIEQLRTELQFWDDYLLDRATIIHEVRHAYCDYLNAHPELASRSFHIKYHPSLMTRERLAEKFMTEIAAHRTLIGPQKDDFEFQLTTREDNHTINVHKFGSRSQQRITLLWLKLLEISYLQEHLKMDPILLLDDIFSEFDHANREMIVSLIPKFQTVITSTEGPEEADITNEVTIVKV